MDLSEALTQFDRTIANLERLEEQWKQFELHIPTSISFGLDTPDVEQIRRDYAETARALPAIDGYRVDPDLFSLDEISQWQLDAWEISEPSALRGLEDFKQEPKRQLDEYRHRLTKERRRLVRRRIEEVVTEVDKLLRSAGVTERGREFPIPDKGWTELREMITELDRLRGSATLRGTRIVDLNRHLRFAEPHDLNDIVENDWPSVRSGLIDLVFEGEPLTVTVTDLSDLVRAEPTGSVTAKLEWAQLDPPTFERLIFNILRNADSYENVEWLTDTNAPDRGRDISAVRVVVDELSGTERRDVAVQCRHWQARSIGVRDLTVLLEEIGLSSRTFAEVIIATSGRFSQDAVEWRETRELEHKSPIVTFWPGPHLEHLLALRPAIRSAYF